MPKKNSGKSPATNGEQKPAQQFADIGEFFDFMKRFPPVYFGANDGAYWFQPKDQWLQLSTRSLGLHFMKRGLSKAPLPPPWHGFRQIDWPIFNAEENNVVHYAGPLAGHRCGLHNDSNGKRWLVTEQSHGVFEEKLPETEPSFFIEFIQELLPGDQWLYFCYWLAFGLASLRRGDFAPGQAVFFAGPAQCGKSLAQYIITKILGGRSADPFDYMFGDSKFNASLITAEHWCTEDPPLVRKLEMRNQFGEKLKACANNREFKCHRKGKDEETVVIFRRVSISLNDEGDHLAVVPPLVEGTADKVFLFKCDTVISALDRFIVTEAQPTLAGMGQYVPKGQLDRFKVQATIESELPAIRGWLLKNFSNVPAPLADRRYGIKAWHHPDLLQEVNAMEPCERLLVFVDQVWWDEKFPTPWVGKSTDMEKQLRDAHGQECERLLWGANAMGTHLKKLLKRYPHRISKRVVSGYTHWTILPPLKAVEPETQKEQQAA
jgi:hypothetical protein